VTKVREEYYACASHEFWRSNQEKKSQFDSIFQSRTSEISDNCFCFVQWNENYLIFYNLSIKSVCRPLSTSFYISVCDAGTSLL
jgi:hypothetical protein